MSWKILVHRYLAGNSLDQPATQSWRKRSPEPRKNSSIKALGLAAKLVAVTDFNFLLVTNRAPYHGKIHSLCRAGWTVQTKNEYGDDDVEMVFGPYPETEDLATSSQPSHTF